LPFALTFVVLPTKYVLPTVVLPFLDCSMWLKCCSCESPRSTSCTWPSCGTLQSEAA
jgi:hypothetical protein